MTAFQVKLGANDLNCVDVPLNPTHSLTHAALISVVQVMRCIQCCLVLICDLAIGL